MNVSEMMTANPIAIHKDKSIFDAVELMRRIGCHHLPVIGSEGHMIGILSDHDCRKALNWSDLWQEREPEDEKARRLTVGPIMTPGPIVIEPDAPVHEAARLMLVHNVRCLPVMRAETLVGIITTTDIIMAFINAEKRAEQQATVQQAHELRIT